MERLVIHPHGFQPWTTLIPSSRPIPLYGILWHSKMPASSLELRCTALSGSMPIRTSILFNRCHLREFNSTLNNVSNADANVSSNLSTIIIAFTKWIYKKSIWLSLSSSVRSGTVLKYYRLKDYTCTDYLAPCSWHLQYYKYSHAMKLLYNSIRAISLLSTRWYKFKSLAAMNLYIQEHCPLSLLRPKYQWSIININNWFL